MPDAGHLFLSYNSRDRDKVRAVQRHLSERGVATFLDQQNLRAGQNWPQALERALRDSRAVAVFVGAVIGNWQWPEIGFALDRQAADNDFLVIPVLLDGANIAPSFLFLNTWLDLRGERLHDVVALDGLVEALSISERSRAAPRPEINPFRGLEYFDEAHASFFFGRETVVDALFDRLTRQRKRLVAVIGASGSGKSSVVRAGLIPRLRRRRPPHETWDVAVLTPGERPWFRVAAALGPLRFPDKADTELDIEIDRLAAALQSGELGLHSLLDRVLQRQAPSHRLLLVVDQFEELFTLASPPHRQSFIASLLQCLSLQGLVLVPTLRADFYGQAIEADRSLGELLGQEQVTLGRLTPDELERAIVEPARLAGLQFDPGLPELLRRDAGNEPGNLPLLQHALLELYENGKATRRLTSADYWSIGGIRGAIAHSAEREFKRCDEKGQGLIVRRVFTQLVRLAHADEGVEDTRRRVATAALPVEAKGIVDEFAGVELRLLVKSSERMAGGDEQLNVPTALGARETVEVAHEALIREWGRLKNWLNEDRGFYLWRQRLDQAMDDHREHGKQGAYLLHGPALAEAEGKLAAPAPEPLTPDQHSFIQASLERRRHEEGELARREHEALTRERDAMAIAAKNADAAQKAERDRREAAERARQLSWYGTAVLFCIGAIAIFLYFQSEAQRKLATAQTLILRAGKLEGKGDRTRAAGLGALSLLVRSTQEGKDLAIAMLGGEFRGRPLRGHEKSVFSVAISADGTHIVSGSSDNTLRLWDAKTGRQIRAPMRGHDKTVLSVAINADGTRVVSGSSDNTLRLWDAKTGQPIGTPLRGHGGWVWSVAFSADGTRIVSGSEDNTLRLWDARTGQPVGEPLLGHGGSVWSVAFSADGTRIVSGSSDNTLRLWDANTGQPIGKPLHGHESSVWSVAFSTDGTRIVSGGDDKTLRLWDAKTGQAIGAPLRGHEGTVHSVAINTDGTRIVSGGEDNTLRLWDAKTGHPIGDPLRGHEGAVLSVAFSTDGTRIVSGGSDNMLRLWDAKASRPIGEPVRGHEKSVLSVAINAGGTRVVSGGDDKTLRQWDAKTGEPIGEPLRGHEGAVGSVAISADDTRIVSGSSDNTLRLWDAKTGRPIGEPLRGHEDTVRSLAINANGTRIVSGSDDKTLRLWNAKTGEAIGQPFRGHEGAVGSVAISADGTRIVSGSSDNTLRLWDAKTGQPIGGPLRGHESWVWSVAISADGKRIVSGSSDKTLRLWDAKTGRPIGEPLRGHEGAVWSVAFNADGTRIVSGGDDNTLRLWDAKTGRPIGEPLRAHEDTVRSVALNIGGTRLVSGSDDRTLRLWDARLIEVGDDLRSALCQTLHRNLTRQEWTQYVPQGEDFRAVCKHLPLEK